MQVLVLQVSTIAFIAGCVGYFVYFLAGARSLVAPVLGSRGERRQRALAGGGVLSAIEPAVRLTGAWFQWLPIDGLRAAIDRRLSEAGHYLGLCADEFLGLCLLNSLGCTVALG